MKIKWHKKLPWINVALRLNVWQFRYVVSKNSGFFTLCIGPVLVSGGINSILVYGVRKPTHDSK